MKRINIPLAIITVIIICILWGTNHKTEESSTPMDSKNNEEEQIYESSKVPPFVEALLDSAEWEISRTITKVNNQTYHYAYDFHNRTSLIYNNERILVEDPTLFAYFTSREEKQMHVGVAGKIIGIDAKDSSSLAKLTTLSNILPSFQRFKKDHWLDSTHIILYHYSVDYPTPSIPHANEINAWIVKKVNQSANEREETQRNKYRYKGEKNNPETLAQFAANCYFDYIRHEYEDLEELPNFHHFNFDLRARLLTNLFVTYQKATHSHSGGAHGYFTEELVSYDFINKTEIDWDYLFKSQYKKDIESLFIDCVCNDLKYAFWENANDRDAIIWKFSIKDEDSNPTGELLLPQPGLTKEGIVFSFQPYDLSCFAAGTFHFTIPYEKAKPFLTEKGKRCIEAIRFSDND